MPRARRKLTDGIEIIYRTFYADRPKRIAALDKAIVNDQVARKIRELRSNKGLTQARLAKLVGTTTSVISRLEDADYEGHSVAMLNRIAAALNTRLSIDFLPLQKTRRSA